jgi:uncharacterized protein YyaL (SSP411 family)
MNNSTMEDNRPSNHLISESSPYLLQHAYNPVDWYPWGEEALEKAKKENKLILVSIGYAACHWCHVMEHESFEDSTVAEIMNSHFVSIKVDREERPDIDDIYMTACQLTSGRGCGWPLNCVALPDGRPVWAGTYFPKEEWKRILNYFQDLRSKDPQKLEESAKQITQGIQAMDEITPVQNELHASSDILDELASSFASKMDRKKGGRTGAPKFPMPNGLMFLQRSDYYLGHSDAKISAQVTLDELAKGGIYDHIGGGFARYSVDADWKVPHFEKMLYDNGQLLSAYAEAYKLTQSERYLEVINQTIEFAQRELMADDGGFYSSLDADSEGKEGKSYIWSEDEIDQALTGETHLDFYKKYYNITKNGNWEEDANILFVTDGLTKIADKFNLDLEQASQIVKNYGVKLLEERSKRIRPGLDDKILCSWNGLMLKGLIDAYEATGNKNFLDLALKNANFIKSNLMSEENRLFRNFKNGKASINGFLDDYAFVIHAYIGLYQVTFDESWLYDAKKLQDYTDAHFLDTATGFYFYTSDLDPALIARKKELADNVTPGSNSSMARNLYHLGHYFYSEDYLERAQKMLNTILPSILDSGQPGFYSNWCILYSEMTDAMYEVAVVGEASRERALELQKHYLPNALYLGGKKEGTLALLEDKLQEGRTMIYVCQNKVCKFPVEESDAALSLINK